MTTDLSQVKKMPRDAVAQMLSVTPSCITQWREKGLPFNHEPGGKISYDARAVHEWYIAREFAKLGRKPPTTETVSCLDDVGLPSAEFSEGETGKPIISTL